MNFSYFRQHDKILCPVLFMKKKNFIEEESSKIRRGLLENISSASMFVSFGLYCSYKSFLHLENILTPLNFLMKACIIFLMEKHCIFIFPKSIFYKLFKNVYNTCFNISLLMHCKFCTNLLYRNKILFTMQS